LRQADRPLSSWAKSAVVFLAGFCFGKLGLLFVQILIGRALGVASYGRYSLGLSLVMIVQWLASLGLDWGVLRYCAIHCAAERPEQVKSTIRAAVILSLTSSMLLAAATVLVAPVAARRLFDDPELGTTVVFFALALPFYVLVRMSSSFEQSIQEMGRATVVQHISQPFLNLLLLLGALAVGLGLSGAVGTFVLATMISAGIGCSWMWSTYRRLPAAQTGFSECRQLLRYSLALMLIGITYQGFLRTPNVLLGYLAGPYAVGLYSAGQSVPWLLILVPSMLTQPFFPLMVRLYEQNRIQELRELYRKVSRWNFVVVLPVFLVLCVFPQVVTALFGEEFSEARGIVIPLSAAWLVYFSKGPVASLLDMTGRQDVDLLNMIAAGLLNVMLNLLLIPLYGTTGAAFSTAIVIVAWAGVEYAEVRSLYGIVPWSSGMIRLVVVGVLAAVAGIAIQLVIPWPVAMAASIVVYVVLFLGWGQMTEDRELFHELLTALRASVRLRLGVGTLSR